MVAIVSGQQNQAGTRTATTTVKTTPEADQIEVYNLGDDPLELVNLAGSTDATVVGVVAQLAALLGEQNAQKRLVPQSGVVPGEPVSVPA